jgi:hypothetical protein
MRVEFDGEGNAENSLARLWISAEQGDRQRITDAAFDVEAILEQNPHAGVSITNGVSPPVRHLDWDILRVFYRIDGSRETVVIIRFTLSG